MRLGPGTALRPLIAANSVPPMLPQSCAGVMRIDSLKRKGQSLTELEMAGGRPQHAGWLDWDDMSEAWSDEK